MPKAMNRPVFVRDGKSMCLRTRLFRNMLLKQPAMQRTMLRYLFSLEGQMKRGKLSEDEALEKLKNFDLGLRNLMRDIHTKLNKDFSPKANELQKLDQTDLTKPINMQLVLQNPDSYTSQMMNSITFAIIEEINLKTEDNIVANALNEKELDALVEERLANETNIEENEEVKRSEADELLQ